MTEIVQLSPEQEKIFVVEKSVRVPEKDYGKVLSLLNSMEYIDKRTSIKRKEVRFDYYQGRVLLQHTFPISLLTLYGFSLGDGNYFPLKFSENLNRDREINSKLSEILKN